MVHTYTYNGLTWVDIESPSREEMAGIVKQYGLEATIGEELLSPSSDSKVELRKNYVYLNLDIPTRAKQGHRGIISKRELDFVIGKDFIITTKYDTIEPLHNFSRIFETNSIIDKKGIGEHAGFIFYYMLKKLYDHTGRDLRNIRDDIKEAENRIFEGQEKRMVTVLSNIGREIIDAQQILRTHSETTELIGIAMEKFFSPNFRYYTDDLSSEYKRIVDSADNLYDLLRELRETNDSLLTTKQNETIKVLTMMAFITFPLSVFVGLIAIHTPYNPIIGKPYDFEIILGLIVLAVVSMLGFFKYKKWL